MGLAVDRRGRVFGRWNDFIRGARSKTNRVRPGLTARKALGVASLLLDLPDPSTLALISQKPEAQQATTFEGGLLSRRPISMKLVYEPAEEELRLAWNIVIRTRDGRHWWSVSIDAENGEMLSKADWISRESYRVFGPSPVLTPDDGAHVITSPPALIDPPVASPFGWHDADGIAGPEYTDTRGNNVFAQEDTNADDLGGFRPDAGVALDFDFAVDLAQEPSSYQAASVTSLFYWVNIAHDVFYQYGFDEASGNFQFNNYGRGGTESDPVIADAQDGSGTNNAQFGAPPDGFAGIMEMFLFSAPIRLQITAPPGIAGLYGAGTAEFGPAPPSTPLVDEVVAALDAADGAGPTTTDACSALTNPSSVNGKIALIDRGICNFTEKVANAEAAGAIAVIIANNAGDALVTMGGVDPGITIPSLFIGQTDGATIRAELGSVTASISSFAMRDGALDAGIVIHEYGHGVTSRLTGGSANASCLNAAQSQGLGEGWSDFFSLFFGAQVGDTGAEAKPMGTYVLAQPSTGNGIRTQPYSTNMSINTLTLADMSTASPPHGVGEVWAASLWEIFWELVAAHGFDPDIYAGTGGNNLALQFVIDGLKLQACNPTFIEARDAILLAEANATSEVNRCLLWRGFAKRGLGAAASVSGNPSQVSAVEDFSLPANCAEFCADGAVSITEQCDDANLIDLDGCSRTCRVEESYLFQGVAQGGGVEFVVEGETVPIATLAGETAAEVAAKMAAAIAANPILAGLGVVANANGDSIVVAGAITSSSVTDPGLAPPLPLSDWLSVILSLLLLTSGTLWLNSRQYSRNGGSISE